MNITLFDHVLATRESALDPSLNTSVRHAVISAGWGDLKCERQAGHKQRVFNWPRAEIQHGCSALDPL